MGRGATRKKSKKSMVGNFKKGIDVLSPFLSCKNCVCQDYTLLEKALSVSDPKKRRPNQEVFNNDCSKILARPVMIA
jgi:hypothetical protein